MAENGYIHWALVHKIVMMPNHPINGTMHTAVLFVTNVPPTVDYQGVKDTLEQAGRFYGDAGVRWGNYQLYPDNDWIAGWEYEFTDPAREKVAYDDLVEQSKIDKRITLRLPPVLHTYLNNNVGNASMNQMIIDILEAWRQERLRGLLYQNKLLLHTELQSYIKSLEQVAGPEHINHYGNNVRVAYRQYLELCKQENVQPEFAVVTSVPKSLREF